MARRSDRRQSKQDSTQISTALCSKRHLARMHRKPHRHPRESGDLCRMGPRFRGDDDPLWRLLHNAAILRHDPPRASIDVAAARGNVRPMRIAAILVAAGSGSRFGADTPKQFLALAGKPVIRHAAEALAASVTHLQPVGDAAPIEAALAGLAHLPTVARRRHPPGQRAGRSGGAGAARAGRRAGARRRPAVHPAGHRPCPAGGAGAPSGRHPGAAGRRHAEARAGRRHPRHRAARRAVPRADAAGVSVRRSAGGAPRRLPGRHRRRLAAGSRRPSGRARSWRATTTSS